MLYTETDVMDYIEQEDVKFIRLVFTDMFGLQKNISIMPKELPKAFRSGISFDASAVRGFGAEDKSDLFLVPDPSTLSLLPWRPSQGRVVRLFCGIRRPDGTPLEEMCIRDRPVSDQHPGLVGRRASLRHAGIFHCPQR